MRLVIAAVGRIRSGPERDLVNDYRERASRTGRALGLGPLDEIEAERRPRESDADALERVLPGDGVLIALDERGKALDSASFAARLGRWRDDGRGGAAFAIGGADGHSETLRARADLVLALGPQTWPHKLARVMLAEQIYRAITILAGTPYHRS